MNVARAVTYETASSSPSARAIRNAPCPPCGGATHGPRAPRLGRPPARVTTAAMAHGPIARDGGMAGRERPGRRFSAPEFATKTLSWRPERRRRFPTCRRRCAAAAKLDVLSSSVQAVEEAFSAPTTCHRVQNPRRRSPPWRGARDVWAPLQERSRPSEEPPPRSGAALEGPQRPRPPKAARRRASSSNALERERTSTKPRASVVACEVTTLASR